MKCVLLDVPLKEFVKPFSTNEILEIIKEIKALFVWNLGGYKSEKHTVTTLVHGHVRSGERTLEKASSGSTPSNCGTNLV